MQIHQLLGPVNYREFRETGQREIEFLVDWDHFIHCGSSTSLHIRGNPTEKLFHIFVFLEQRVKYSECRLEVLLNHICKKKKQTNKQISSILGLGKRYAKFRTGKICLGIALTVCTYQSNHLLKLPGTGINDGFEEMEHSFRLEWRDFRMTLKNVSVSVCYLFYQPMDEKVKTWTLRFPVKENPNMEKALLDDWPLVLQDDVKA